MMELTTCAFVVSLVSLVTATPYGYGVKGGAGAAAKAESIASAGAYGGRGDIPEGLPFGNGFSGSFSKSSSSSSSSSSASSSSSSSSFSYSGTGGFVQPGSQDHTNCKSGSCQNSGANEVLANGAINPSSGLHGYNVANAGSSAAAISGAQSGAGCQGNSCNLNAGKCTSGKCQTNLHTGPSHDSNNKCISGQCGSSAQTGPSAAQYDDTDDIRFVAHSSESVHNSKDTTTGHAADSGCTSGNCASPTHTLDSPNSYHNSSPSNQQGGSPGYLRPAADLETPKCSSGNCNPGQPEPTKGNPPSSYNVPIHGTYDNNNKKTQCNDGTCGSAQTHKTPSYNYQGTVGCVGSECGSAPYGQTAGSPTDNHSALPSPHSSPSPTACNSPNCHLYPAIGSNKPNAQASQPPHHATPSNEKLPVYTGGFGAPAGGCSSPNCYGQGSSPGAQPSSTPNSPTYGSALPGCSSPNCYGQGTSPGAQPSSTSKNPAYASVSPGCSSPNCYGQGSSPGAQPSSTPNSATYGSASPGCSSPNCYGQGSSPGSQPSSGIHLPSGSLDVPEKPYTAGFGGPAGMLKPNEYSVHGIPPSSSYNTPSTTTAGCKTPHCVGSAPVTSFTSGATAQSGSYGIHGQNNAVAGSTDKLPTYTGGFGGPTGMLKPDEHDVKGTVQPGHPNNPMHGNHPINPVTPGCKTPNCNTFSPATGPTATANINSLTKPVPSADTSSELPPYTGGFGGPTGFLKPSEYNPSHSVPNSQNSPYAGKPQNHLPSCTTPDCNPSKDSLTPGKNPPSPFGLPKPSTLLTSPGYTDNYNSPVGATKPSFDSNVPSTQIQPSGPYPAGCKTPNCGAYPVSGSAVQAPSGSYGSPTNNVKPSSPQYTGGYGVPSSVVTPNDHANAKPGVPSNCKTPNCSDGLSPSVGASAQSGSHADSKQQLPAYTGGFGSPSGFLKPNDHSTVPASTTYNKPSSAHGACGSGNCDSKVTPTSSYNTVASGAHASASASANAVAYSGGFGGPPGFLKPFDDGKIDLSKLVGGQNPGSPYDGTNIKPTHDSKPGQHSSGTTPNTGTTDHFGGQSTGASAGSAASATAHAGSLASSGSYGYHPHGSYQSGGGVKGSSPCGGGCNSGYQDGGNGSGSAATAGAKSLANSGTFGAGGSYASSSASAHSSAGSYTKGGYGKR